MEQKRAYRYRCYPMPSQRQMLARTFGCARFIYNFGLRLRTEAYQERGEHLFYHDTSAALTRLKQQPEYGWLNEVSSMSDPLPIRWSRPLPSSPNTVGIDLGLSDVVTLSTGEKTGNEHFFQQEEHRLARVQRRHAKKQKGSKNREKARRKVARIHARIADRRRDFQQRLTTRLIRENQVVCVESLAIENMLKNHCLAKAIADVGWGELLRQLEYKARWYGRTLVAVNRWYPSSKRCSAYSHELDPLSLRVREWTCPACGTAHDRDINAACNTKAEGLSVFACGEVVRPNLHGTREGTPRRSRKPTSRGVESHSLLGNREEVQVLQPSGPRLPHWWGHGSLGHPPQVVTTTAPSEADVGPPAARAQTDRPGGVSREVEKPCTPSA